MRTSLVVTILAMAVVGVTLAVVTGEVYRKLALENQRNLLSGIVELEVQEQLEDAKAQALELAQAIAANPALGRALTNPQSSPLETLLAEAVERHAAAMAMLDVERLSIFDQAAEPLAVKVLERLSYGEHVLPCYAPLERMAQRSGASVSSVSSLCKIDGQAYLASLVAIDGPAARAYLQIINEPALSIRKIEKRLNLPLLIRLTNGQLLYRSSNWPQAFSADTVLKVDHSVKDEQGDAYLSVSLAVDVADFSHKLNKTDGLILAGAAVITLFAVLIALSLLQRSALLPLHLLTRQLRLLRQGKEHLGEQVLVNGNKELCQLAEDFNAVSLELRDVYQQLEKLAFTDTLTGLPNRELFYDRLTQLILLARRAPADFSLFVMDLDRFKFINDTLGHHVGDELLRQAGARINAAVRESDTVARLGGDEFAALLPRAVDRQGAAIVANRIHAAMAEPFVIDGHHLHAGVSIGIVMYPYHGEDQHELMQRADVAMYHAKRNHMGFAFYEPEIDKHNVFELTLETELKHAIRDNALQLFYQPKIVVDSGEVYGVEALLRWIHPERGFIAPDSFIPMAEQTGLIHPLTQWVLKTALAQAQDWQGRGVMLNVAINLSALSLRDPNLTKTIQAALDTAGLEPHYLTLELTETAVMSDPHRALDILGELDQMGVRLSIDDFGTGYSSLAYLKQLPMDELKIDRSFVMEMDQDKNDAVIVHSTIDLAHNMGLKVVAEGVETEQSWHTLQALGCDLGQGYYMCKPVDAVSFDAWLETSDFRVSRQPGSV